MNPFRTAALALVAGLSLLLTGCVNVDDDGEPLNAIVTIPSAAPARTAAVQAVRELPGVQEVASTYYGATGIMDMRVQYQAVPDRWPFDEKVLLAVESAVRPYQPALEEITLRVRIVENEPGVVPVRASTAT